MNHLSCRPWFGAYDPHEFVDQHGRTMTRTRCGETVYREVAIDSPENVHCPRCLELRILDIRLAREQKIDWEAAKAREQT